MSLPSSSPVLRRTSDVPTTYVDVAADDGSTLFVPGYLINHARLETRTKTNVARAMAKQFDEPIDLLGSFAKPLKSVGNSTFISVEQSPTPEQAAGIHMEVLTMAESLNIPYKDAAHQIYLSKVAKLQSTSDALNGIAQIRRNFDDLVANGIVEPILTVRKQAEEYYRTHPTEEDYYRKESDSSVGEYCTLERQPSSSSDEVEIVATEGTEEGRKSAGRVTDVEMDSEEVEIVAVKKLDQQSSMSPLPPIKQEILDSYWEEQEVLKSPTSSSKGKTVAGPLKKIRRLR
ncbi:hypothetical protein BDN70DRAFT_939104 [Pholiota conissans]|uniref:Uncharacterized protein n=1 Tax=Pholiota conissans TaxID=109636 RepID=A0A9P6CSM8_9AGAR|nr:hypothetical protein BDN70DRAFT_939104 [Pholiota conissans]